MFSKPNRVPAEGAAPAGRKPAPASLIAEGLLLRGELSTDGDVHLDGTLEGQVSVGRLTIGEPGVVTGTIEADSVEVRGRVTGSINARQVRLCATARVDGDITHAELSVEAGARFEGRSLQVRPPADSAPARLLAAATAAE